MTDKQIKIDGHDVSKGNQKYMKESSPVENWYKAKINTVDGINLAECVHFTRQVDFGYCELSNDSCNEFQYSCVKNKNCYYKQLKRKEQECERLRFPMQDTNYAILAKEEFEEYKKLKQTLAEIKDIARVNSINTCWTAINLCADCDEIKECGLQSPFEKLKAIIQKISECEANQ